MKETLRALGESPIFLVGSPRVEAVAMNPFAPTAAKTRCNEVGAYCFSLEANTAYPIIDFVISDFTGFKTKATIVWGCNVVMIVGQHQRPSAVVEAVTTCNGYVLMLVFWQAHGRAIRSYPMSNATIYSRTS